MKKQILILSVFIITGIAGLFIVNNYKTLCSLKLLSLQYDRVKHIIYSEIYNYKEPPIESYKSIVPTNKTMIKHAGYNDKQILDIIKEQDKDIEKYLKEFHSNKNKNKIYSIYYENLRNYISFMSNFRYPELAKSTTEPEEFNYNGVDYVFTPLVGEETISYSFETNCKSVKPYHFTEGIIIPDIDANYQYYLSLFLNSNWQKFWQLRKQVQDDLGFNLEVWNDGSLMVELDTIAKWLVEWSKFEKQNNNPLLTKEINQRIDVYTYAFMIPNVYDYTNWQDVESDYEYSDYKRPRKITLIGRAKYEKLLKNIPYNSKANEILSKGYYILKHNNYTSNEAYYALFPEAEEQQENE